MKKTCPFSFASFALALSPILVLFLLPTHVVAQDQHQFRDIQPVGSPRALVSDPVSDVPAEAGKTLATSVTEIAKAAGGPKTEESAIQDSVSATDLAWAYFEKQNWTKAQEWFTLALEWYPGNLHAAEGLVMSMFEDGDSLTAYYVAKELDSKIPGIQKMIVESVNNRAQGLLDEGKIAEARATVTGFPSDEGGFATMFTKIERAAETGVLELATVNGGEAGMKVTELPSVPTEELLQLAEGAMQEGRYHVSQWYLDQAESREALPRNFQVFRAWNFYHTRQFAEGAALFEKLYREEEDLECAEGVAFCLQQSKNIDKLTEVSTELGGMLMSTAAPVINAAKAMDARQIAENPNALASGDELPDPQYAPTSALEAAGEPVAIPKPITERLQATR